MKKILLSLVALLSATFSFADTVVLDFNEWNFPGASDWTTSYAEHVVTFDNATVTFAKANKQASTMAIASCPVTKGYDVTVESNSNIVSASVVLKQWGSKTKTAKIKVNDEEVATSSDFSFSNVSINANKFVISFTETNNQVGIVSITLETDGGTTPVDTKKSAGLKWDPSTIDYIVGDAFTAPTFTKETTAAVTFTTDDDEVATVDENGVITLQGGVGPVNITATCEANDEYQAGKAVCAITVSNVKEVTCAEAAQIALALESNSTPTSETYSVTGYITSTNGTVSSNQQTFWMADTKDGGNVFEGYYANLPEPYEALTVGTKIKMIGKLMKYNTTPEMKNGNVTVLEKSEVKVDTIECNAHEAYTACQALASGSYSNDVYKITAYVDSVTFAYSSGTQSFTLTDVKGQKGDSLVVYKTNIPEAVISGAKVCVIGKLQNYKGTVMEVAGGNTTILAQGAPDTIQVTAAEAYKIGATLASGKSSEAVYDITAYVDSITYAYSNGTESFTLTDVKGVKGDSLLAYKTSLPEEAFVGAKVRIKGYLKNYNGVIEIANGEGEIIEQGSATIKGDVNGDNVVDIADVNAIISVICGGEKNDKADVNGDNVVDIADVNAVIGIICGGN